MSYCVNCGVELDKSLKSCPLCSTPVINPNESFDVTDMNILPTYPPDSAAVVRQLRYYAALLISIILLVPTLLCPLCNFIITGKLTWSLFVIYSVVYAWFLIVPPIFLKNNVFVKCVWIDFAASTAFLMTMNSLTTPDRNWFAYIALPIMIYIMLGIYFSNLLYRNTHRVFSVILIFLVLAGIFSVMLEYLILSFGGSEIHFVWSVPTAVSCIGLSAVLTVISHMVRLKSSFKKRMHL